LGAVEMHEFVPSCAELLAIAKHWARVAIERTYVEWANATNTDDWRRIYFAWRRVYRVRALIGEVVDGVIDNKIKEFYEEQGRSWEIGRASCRERVEMSVVAGLVERQEGTGRRNNARVCSEIMVCRAHRRPSR